MALAYVSIRLIQLTNAGAIPRAAEIGVDTNVLLFTVGAGLFTGILFGLAPIIPLALQSVQASLKETVGSTTGTAAAQGCSTANYFGFNTLTPDQAKYSVFSNNSQSTLDMQDAYGNISGPVYQLPAGQA